jgi:hypothetical protein
MTCHLHSSTLATYLRTKRKHDLFCLTVLWDHANNTLSQICPHGKFLVVSDGFRFEDFGPRGNFEKFWSQNYFYPYWLNRSVQTDIKPCLQIKIIGDLFKALFFPATYYLLVLCKWNFVTRIFVYIYITVYNKWVKYIFDYVTWSYVCLSLLSYISCLSQV